MASEQQQQQESKTIPLKVLVDKHSNKVVFVEATKDFIDTIFSFLSLPLATIVRLLATINNNNDQQHRQLPESSPFLGNIKNLYQSVQNINSNDFWTNPVCKQMLLRPRNPCESLCKNLFLNIDDSAESSTEFYVCDSCYTFTTFPNFNCTCGKTPKRRPLDSECQGNNAQNRGFLRKEPNRKPRNLDSKGQGNDAKNGVFPRKGGPMFLVSDDLKVLPSSTASSLMMLVDLGCSDLTQLEEVTHNIGKQEILNLLKYTLISHEPLTNTILKSRSKIKYNLPNQSTSAARVVASTSNSSRMDIKVVQSKSQKKVVFTEDNGDFVDFIFSFLTIPLGSVVKLLGANSFAGCVGNLYKSVENLDPVSVLLNPGIAPQFGSPNQPLNIPHVELPTYYYGMNFNIDRNVISKIPYVEFLFNGTPLVALDPKSKEGVAGFVKRTKLYGLGDDLKVKPLSTNFFLSHLKELSLPLGDLEVKMISIGEAEALSCLGAFLTSKFTLTSGLQDFLNMAKQKSTFLKVPKQESTLTSKSKQTY